jgi:hypothetical protein
MRTKHAPKESSRFLWELSSFGQKENSQASFFFATLLRV